MRGVMVCMGDGVQDDGLRAIPRYFDFQREVIDGSFFDSAINRFLIKLVFRHISAETIKPWREMTQIDLINIVEHSYRYHQRLNAVALQSAAKTDFSMGLRGAKDADILENMEESARLVTPNDVFARVEPFSIRQLVPVQSGIKNG